MDLREKLSRYERYDMGWQRLLLQGVVITLTGLTLALASVFNPHTFVLFAHDLSWLPVSAIIILALGLLECVDAFLAKEQRDFFQHLQVGVLDAVVGALILLNVAAEPARLSLMLAAFLIARGIVRTVLVFALRLPHTVSTSLGGVASIAMGIMIWLQWPTHAGWFLSLCLNLEIAFRGWAMMMFALWVRKRPSVALWDD